MPKPAYSSGTTTPVVSGSSPRLGGSPSHEVVERALTALFALAPRGGLDAAVAAEMAPAC